MAIGFCTDCGTWSPSTAVQHGGRCGCGSGRIAMPPAGYRILAPGELDNESLERAAEIVDEQNGPNAMSDAIRALKGGSA